MELYHFSLFFIIFALALLCMDSAGTAMDTKYSETCSAMDRISDRAVDAAAAALVEYDISRDDEAEEVIGIFISAMLAGMGCESDSGSGSGTVRADLERSLILAAFTCPGGCRIRYMSDGAAGWTDMIPLEEGSETEALESLLDSFLNGEGKVTGSLGYDYSVSLPSTDSDLYGRCMTENSVLIFLQDYPLQGCDRSYSRYCVSQAGLAEVHYFVTDVNGIYHLQGCGHIGTEIGLYLTKKECAKAGAYPCAYCI